MSKGDPVYVSVGGACEHTEWVHVAHEFHLASVSIEPLHWSAMVQPHVDCPHNIMFYPMCRPRSVR